MSIIRCFKGFSLAFLVMLIPLLFIHKQYHLGENVGQFIVLIALVFFIPFILFDYLTTYKFINNNGYILATFCSLFIFSELVFYLLPENITQFYYTGNWISNTVLLLSVLPVGLVIKPIFRRVKSVVIIQKEID